MNINITNHAYQRFIERVSKKVVSEDYIRALIKASVRPTRLQRREILLFGKKHRKDMDKSLLYTKYIYLVHKNTIVFVLELANKGIYNLVTCLLLSKRALEPRPQKPLLKTPPNPNSKRSRLRAMNENHLVWDTENKCWCVEKEMSPTLEGKIFLGTA